MHSAITILIRVIVLVGTTILVAMDNRDYWLKRLKSPTKGAAAQFKRAVRDYKDKNPQWKEEYYVQT